MCANEMLAKNPKVFESKELPKTALSRESDRFSGQASEAAKRLGSRAWSCPATRPKTMRRLRAVLSERPTLLRKA